LSRHYSDGAGSCLRNSEYALQVFKEIRYQSADSAPSVAL